MKKVLALATFLAVFTLSMSIKADNFVPDSEMPRSEVPDVYKWDLGDIFPTRAAWETDYEKVQNNIDLMLQDCKGKLGSSKDVLESCYLRFYDLVVDLLKVYIYAEINFYTEMSNKTLAQDVQAAEILSAKFDSAFAFMNPEVKSLGEKTAIDWIDASALKEYTYSFAELFRLKDHILSDKEEKLKAMLAKVFAVPNNMYHSIEIDLLWDEFVADSVLVDGTKEAQTVKMNIGNWSKYRVNPKRWVRENAARAFLNSLGNYGHIYATNLTNALDVAHFNAVSSKYDSVVKMKLDSSNIPVEVHSNLINAVSDGLPATLHKYVSFKKKVLKLDEFRFWDNYASMMPSYTAKINYNDSVNLIATALKPYLGNEYVKNFRMATDPESGWVDIYPNKDKYSGAFNYGVYGVHPFLLLNHQDRYRDMFVIAHEGGHSMHSYYTGLHQGFPFYYMDPFLAEVASTTNEVTVYDYLIKKARKEKNRDMLLYLYDSLLDNLRQTLMRQTQFAEFEQIIHQRTLDGEPTTLDFFNKTYAELIKKYYGPDFTMIELEEGEYLDSYEWMFISHFLRPFYVYAYATSVSAGVAIAKGLQDGSITPDMYIDGFLSKGSNGAPCEILKNAGVDLTSPVPIKEAMDYFAHIMNKFEKLYFENKF